jgi:hypothetical protein
MMRSQHLSFRQRYQRSEPRRDDYGRDLRRNNVTRLICRYTWLEPILLESCLAMYLDLLGTCILTDEVTQGQSIYLDDRSTACLCSHIAEVSSARWSRIRPTRPSVPRLLSVNSTRHPISGYAKAASKRRAAHDNREAYPGAQVFS